MAQANSGKQGKQHKNPKGDVGGKSEKVAQEYEVVKVWDNYQLLRIDSVTYDLCHLDHIAETSKRFVTIRSNSPDHAIQLATNFM